MRTPALRPARIPAVRPLAAGGTHSCVIRGGEVDCWGSNNAGALGIGVSSGPQTCSGVACSPAPVTAIGLSVPVISVAAGGDETCALLTGGTVACWGPNDLGQLGNGSTYGPETCQGVPCSTTPGIVSGVSGATAVATNDGEACAVLSSGTVECWGSNFAGELGNDSVGTGGTAGSPVPVTVLGLTHATAIAVGSLYACALLLDGTVECWGSNAYGQLGNGSTTDSTTPVSVSGVTGAVAIAAGWYHACALSADGTLACWGDNGNGELGLGTSTGPQTCPGNGDPCAPTPMNVPNLSSVMAIAAGFDATCALLSDGTGRCWGWNYQGELGNGTMTGASSTPVVVSGLTSATAIAMGDEHACALLSSGAVVCWGQNALGQLGSASTGPQTCSLSGYTCSTSPVNVAGL